MTTKADIEQQIYKLHTQGKSNRVIALELLGRKSAESTVRHVIKRVKHQQGLDNLFCAAEEYKESKKHKLVGPKVLILDVETSASIVYSFSRFKAFIKPDQVIQEPYMLTWAGKWLGNPNIISYKLPDFQELFDYNFKSDELLIKELWNILDEADIVVIHNAKFDKGWFNQRAMFWGLVPPSPYKIIDTLRELKQICALPSNSLANAANFFELPNRKLDNAGWSLWQGCMEGNPQDFISMETYNVGDITTLENLYLKLRPFMQQHPNVSLYTKTESPACVVCGSGDLTQIVGKSSYTNLSEFEVLRCNNCGKVNRKRINLRSKEQMKNTLMN